MDITAIAQTRYSTKAFDPSRKIPPALVSQFEQLLRLSPSSTNSQPWHFVVAGTETGKGRVAKAASGPYAFNEAKIRNASHVVVFCVRRGLDEAYLRRLLEQEAADGRFASAEAKENQHRRRSYFVDLHRVEHRDLDAWTEKQVYLAAGGFLLGVAALGIDACPIEGFDAKILDEELGLSAQGLSSCLVVALGTRGPDDPNAGVPKSRLPSAAVLTRI